MAHTIYKFIGEWDTMHNNGPFPTGMLLDTYLEDSARMPSLTDRFNDAAVEVRRLLQEALDKREGFRAMGSRWSLSHIAHHKDRIHHNRSMNIILPVKPSDLHPGSAYRSEDLFMIQCGARIKEISAYLHSRNKALKTTGASNGQTIAGCIATGVHGSAMDVGSVQDYVAGIQLITGPEPDDVVYLEPASRPALNDAFARQIHARVIRDDTIFSAALVSLGSFGFIHGVVIAAEDRYLLKRYFGTMSKADAIRLSTTLRFDRAPQLIQTHQQAILAEVDDAGKGLRPYHFKLIINPYNPQEAYRVEIIYKKPYRSSYPNPIPLIRHTLSPDTISFMSGLLATKRWAIPAAIKLLQGSIFPPVNTLPVEGTIGEIFWDAQHQGPAFAFAVAFDHTHFETVLNLFLSTLTDKKKGYIPGALGIRFVKSTNAMLGFTRFGHTCIIEVDGTLPKSKTRQRRKVHEQLMAFSRHMVDGLRKQHIAFTLHWGKNADWSQPGLLSYMYGNAAKEWMSIRKAMFSNPAVAAMFTNQFLKDIGLDK